MKKQIIKRALRGFPQGVAIGYFLSIVCSLNIGDGNYYACDPDLIAVLGSEWNAVTIQMICTGIIGSAFAGGSVVWGIDSWSLAKQSAVYFAVSAIAMMPISYLLNWVSHSVGGVLRYFFTFTVIWLVFWLANYCVWRCRIKKMNKKLM